MLKVFYTTATVPYYQGATYVYLLPPPLPPLPLKGVVGPKGARGLRGDSGDKGDQGSAGDIGLDGRVGPAGDDGAMGNPGHQGLQGPAVRTTPPPSSPPLSCGQQCILFLCRHQNSFLLHRDPKVWMDLVDKLVALEMLERRDLWYVVFM